MTNESEDKKIRIQDYFSGDPDKQETFEFQAWLAGDAEARDLYKEQVKQRHWVRWAEHWDRINEIKREK